MAFFDARQEHEISEEGPGNDARPSVVAARLERLRLAIARIEDRGDPSGRGRGVNRAGAQSARKVPDLLSLGHARLDACLSGGLSRAGLTEIRVRETRESGAATGLCLALAVLLGAERRHPLLWIGQGNGFAEAGSACRAGVAGFGLDPRALVTVCARRTQDAVWAGEEAARSGAPSLTVLEIRGNPKLLSLEGTRRLHLRARESGRPFILLRQSASAETTTAPVRICVLPHPAAPVRAIAGQNRLIGAPVFRLRVEKAPGGRSGEFLLEWNVHDKRFDIFAASRAAALPRPVAALPFDRPVAAGRTRPGLAIGRA
ncbi:ImuA family protein [Aureimonas mangrovi]|uniref:ImuA family protein n=1 Tax=Aureimonas mangrovi TaxID=2758041 RepID=UPI00163DA02F|nr:hypothetical protein [Aureimonas mangrovi]